MKKWKKWRKGIAGILTGAVFLSSMPASAQDVLTDGTETVVEETGDLFTDGTDDASIDDNIYTEEPGTDDVLSEEPVTQEKTYPVYTSPSLSELGNLAKNEPGAATEVPETVIPAEDQVHNWSFKSFYVQEENTNYVTRDQEFLLKYQMEFHTDCDFENPFDVVIRIPKTLLWQQNGEESIPVDPTAVGIPRCGFAEDGSRIDIPSPATPFNYYEENGEDGADYLVFYNYQAIQAGMETAFQVVYGPVDVTTVEDGTSWSLTPTLQIQDGEPETYPALEGTVDRTVPTLTTTPEPTPTAEPVPPEPTPTAEPASPEPTPTEMPEYPTYDSMSIADLAELDEETVGAATETPGAMMPSLFAVAPGEEKASTWSFDAYYVGQDDPYHVYKTYDFSLKYQMEFHTDYDLTEPGDVVIRIPGRLLTEREKDGGREIFPDDIAVPQGGKNSDGTYVAVESRVTPFNYYVEGENLIFYNYKTIQAGTNAAWQVLYRNLDVSRIKNGSTWKLLPDITVTKRESDPEKPENPPVITKEKRTTTPLTGEVHTTSVLNSVTKDVLKLSDKSYSPGLYTRKQVEQVLGTSLTGKFNTNFSDYVYVGWKVSVDVDVVQPVILDFEDITTYTVNGKVKNGEVVGINRGAHIDYYREEDAERDKRSRRGIRNIQIVTAYPKDEVKPGIKVKNTFQVKMTLYDDGTVKKGEDYASWVYEFYDFRWNGKIYQAWKNGEDSYPGWLNVLEQINAEGNENKEAEAEEYLDAFPFNTETFVNGYGLTHYVDSKNPENLGERIPGTYYEVETKDGFYEWTKDIPGDSVAADWPVTDGFSLHAYSNTSGGSETIPLGKDDFYIKNLSVRRVDKSYDVWEDESINSPEIDTGENPVNQDIHVYAAYVQPGKNQEPEWKKIKVIPWGPDSNGRSYSISNEELKADESGNYPIAVRTSYKGISYNSSCYLNFAVQLRYDSPAVRELLQSDTSEEKSITVRNTARNDFSYKSADGTVTKWQSLYRSRQVTVSQMGKETHSAKTAKVSSDTINGRALVDYNLTARTGYTIYSRESLNYLRAKNAENLLFPDLENHTGKKWIFYDLLPYGMTLDFTKPVTAGRITDLDSDYQTYPQSWDKTGVSVAVDPGADIIDNWKDTGRTMVKFHLTYTGDDPTVYTRDLWMEGWGVSFRARYDWEDIALLEKDSNISAFTPEDPSLSLVGAQYGNTQVPPDYDTDYAPFKKGIRDESECPDPAVKNILYAKNRASDDVAVASTSTIKKRVRSDDDLLNDYSTTAVVKPEGRYTYDVTVTSGGIPTKDLVVYDRLEYAVEDRTEKDTMDFGTSTTLNDVWLGEFAGLDLTEAEKAGIAPKVYYSAKRKASRPRRTNIGQGETDNERYNTPDEVFGANDTDWVLEEKWKRPLSEVKAVAVDLRKTKGGGEYVLPAMESIGFKIKMKAPKNAEPQKPYAYNNPSYYSCPTNTSKPAEMVVGNSVRVELEQKKKNLEISKKFKNKEDIPEKLLDQEFEFTVTYPPINEGKENEYYPPFAYQVYTLWQWKGDQWTEVPDGQVRTTDKEGRFFLHDGEKAVFKDVRGGEDLLVTEEESPFWKQEWTDNKGEETDLRVVECVNSYRPVLYIQKKTQAVPTDKKEEVKKQTFAFEVKASYINAEGNTVDQKFDENTVYWLVDSACTDGGIPNKIKEANFDKDGLLHLHEGETAAVFLESPGSSYTVTERLDKSSNKEDWLCKEPEKSGQASVNGSKVEITNTYRWKELILLKQITHQEPEDVEAIRKDLPFTFEVKEVVTEENGKKKEIPVTDKEWLLLNKDGSEPENGQLPDGTDESEIYDVRGTLDREGRFTCAMANRKVKIKGLEAGKTYVIYEVDYKADDQITEEQKKLLELYKPENGGVLEVTMPVYSIGKGGTITNDYQKRPLTVSKQILLSESSSQKEIEASKTRAFKMTVSVNGKPFANKPYVLLKNGQEIPQENTVTDKTGSFFLKNGESAYFKDAGLIGDSFEVRETPDVMTDGVRFDQIYPPEGGAFEGTLSGEGGNANFINGRGNRLVVMKEYIGGDEKGKEIAGKIPKDPERQKEFAVEAEFVLYDDQGNVIKPDLLIELGKDRILRVQEIDLRTGAIDDFGWRSSQRTLTIEPGKMYILPEYIYTDYKEYDDGSKVWEKEYIDSYRITEAKTDYAYLYREENPYTGKTEETWLHICQKPEGAVTGNIKEKPLAKLVNEITTPGWKDGSLIEKRMSVDGETHRPQEVAKGSVLTLRVERYQEEAGIWLPADGISYLQSDRLTYDGSGYDIDTGYQVTEGNYGVTASDGLITCIKSEKTFAYPVVYFPDNKVHLNLYGNTMPDGIKIADGTLRLVEAPELSDPDWGYLAGYGKAGSLSYSMNEREGTILYNRKGGFLVHIEKVMATDSDETFTMILKQVLSQSQEHIEEPGHILKSQAVPGMDYTVYDRETDREISRNQTGKNGEIFLKAGQYARLDLPENTRWTVEEKLSMTTALESLTGEPRGILKPLSDNLMLIDQPGEAVQVGTVTYDANGGSFYGEGPQASDIYKVRRVSYYMDGNTPTPVRGYEITTPSRYGREFAGWYIRDDTGEKKFDLSDYDCQKDITVYAKWVKRPDVKYAVSLYGIQVDQYKGGRTPAGLTFGPATGKSYRDSYEAHISENKKGHCIHWDSWEEIIAQSRIDPTVYQDCLKHGCTKSVELRLDGKLKKTSNFPSNVDDIGDGASALRKSINFNYLKWNAVADNTGGWPASRIRATLNGADNLTDKSGVAGRDVLTTEECLLSCFPQELQSAIVPKAVKSDTVYNDQKGHNETTYDKLWLFSLKECLPSGVRENEGEAYEKKWSLSYGKYNVYVEDESHGDTWLRSLAFNNEKVIYSVMDLCFYGKADNQNDFSPGFCIP